MSTLGWVTLIIVLLITHAGMFAAGMAYAALCAVNDQEPKP